MTAPFGVESSSRAAAKLAAYVNVGTFCPPAMAFPALVDLSEGNAAGWVLAYPLSA